MNLKTSYSFYTFYHFYTLFYYTSFKILYYILVGLSEVCLIFIVNSWF